MGQKTLAMSAKERVVWQRLATIKKRLKALEANVPSMIIHGDTFQITLAETRRLLPA